MPSLNARSAICKSCLLKCCHRSPAPFIYNFPFRDDFISEKRVFSGQLIEFLQCINHDIYSDPGLEQLPNLSKPLEKRQFGLFDCNQVNVRPFMNPPVASVPKRITFSGLPCSVKRRTYRASSCSKSFLCFGGPEQSRGRSQLFVPILTFRL